MAKIIQVEHLSYVYNPGMPGEVTALDDVSFAVEEGDFVGIIGATGSGTGKSTLIGHMNGLNRPTGGRIIIDGRDVWADPSRIRDFRFLTGLVFQYPEYQLFEETCYKDIAFGPKNMGLDEQEVDRRVREAARFVGLDEALLDRSPFELSGGQKRRVAVAGVMAMEPRILVLDEPAAGLDPEGRDSILSAIKRYHKDTGTTVLLVSHSMEDIARYADKVLVMAAKQVAMYDTVENVFARAQAVIPARLRTRRRVVVQIKVDEHALTQHHGDHDGERPRAQRSANNPQRRAEHLHVQAGQADAAHQPHNDCKHKANHSRFCLTVCLQKLLAVGHASSHTPLHSALLHAPSSRPPAERASTRAPQHGRTVRANVRVPARSAAETRALPATMQAL